MKRTLTTAASLALLLVLALALPAAAQYPPPPPPQITIETPRNVIRVQGTDWGPSTTIVIGVNSGGNSTPAAARTTSDADGAFVVEIPLPDGASADDVVVEVTGTADDGTTMTSTSSLARLGGEAAPVVADTGDGGVPRAAAVAAGVIVAAGLAAGRRRRRSA